MSESENSDSPAREHAVLCVLVDVELDPSALDVDAAGRAVVDVGARVSASLLSQGLRAGAVRSRLLRCTSSALVDVLRKAVP